MLAEVARDAILTLTILACLFLFAHQSPPPKYTSADYCVIDQKAVAIDQLGGKHIVWVKGYGPCSLLDRYEQI